MHINKMHVTAVLSALFTAYCFVLTVCCICHFAHSYGETFDLKKHPQVCVLHCMYVVVVVVVVCFCVCV